MLLKIIGFLFKNYFTKSILKVVNYDVVGHMLGDNT